MQVDQQQPHLYVKQDAVMALPSLMPNLSIPRFDRDSMEECVPDQTPYSPATSMASDMSDAGSPVKKKSISFLPYVDVYHTFHPEDYGKLI